MITLPDPHVPDWRWRMHAGRLEYNTGHGSAWYKATAVNLELWETLELLVVWVSLGYEP